MSALSAAITGNRPNDVGPPVIAVLILAAGSSRRLGRPKQMEMLGGETLIARATRVAKESALGPVYVILRADDERVRAAVMRLDCEIILHEEADEGMAASIRAGVRAVDSWAAGVVLMTCDQPMVTAEHLCRLVQQGGGATGSAYNRRRGVPAWFPAAVFPQLLALRGDTGARVLLKEAKAIDLPGGDIDVDTEEDLAMVRSRFSGK